MKWDPLHLCTQDHHMKFVHKNLNKWKQSVQTNEQRDFRKCSNFRILRQVFIRDNSQLIITISFIRISMPNVLTSHLIELRGTINLWYHKWTISKVIKCGPSLEKLAKANNGTSSAMPKRESMLSCFTQIIKSNNRNKNQWQS